MGDASPVDFTVHGITTTSGVVDTTGGQAAFTYTADLPGADTLTAFANGTSASATATITWVVPASTHYASLGVANFTTPYVYGTASTGSGGPSGLLDWRAPQVTLLTEHFTALVASGTDATLFGTATLSTGWTVTFRLDAATGTNTVRLRLSDRYDSGVLHVMSVRVSP